MTCLTTELTHPDDRPMSAIRFGFGLWHTMSRRHKLGSCFSTALSCNKYDVFLISLSGHIDPGAGQSAKAARDWISSGKGFAMHQSFDRYGAKLVAELNNDSLAHVRDYFLKLADLNALLELCP